MLTSGQVIDGKYRILRPIGEGGMGAVYEAVHALIHRRVAIKVLHAEVLEREDALARFEREAQAAGRIGSEHIVEVLDLGSLPSGARYLVMEFLQGESLSSRLKQRGRMQAHELGPIMLQLLDGVSAAHAAGIVHRDLKPDNIFLQPRERDADFVKILDFGISKFSALHGDAEGLGVTSTGAVMGTPYYMSPEQARGAGQVDHRADIYAAGVILYECLSGNVPFHASSFNDLMFKIVLERPPPLREHVPEVDMALAALVEKAMARDAADRFQTAVEMRDGLFDLLQRCGDVRSGTGTPVSRHEPELADTVDAQNARPPGNTHQSWATSGLGILEVPQGTPARRRRPMLWVGGVVAVAALAVAASLALTDAKPPTGRADVSASSGLGSGSAPVPTPPTEPREGPRVAPQAPIAAEDEASSGDAQRQIAEPGALPTRQPEPRAASSPRSVRVPRRQTPSAAPAATRETPMPAPAVSTSAPPRVEVKAPPQAAPEPTRGKIGDRPIRTSL